MSVENHIIKVSFCGKFQKAVKPKKKNPHSLPFVCTKPMPMISHDYERVFQGMKETVSKIGQNI